jgi:hypothetical protein
LSPWVAMAWISNLCVGQCFFNACTIWSVCTRARSERRVPTWKVSWVLAEVSIAVVAMLADGRRGVDRCAVVYSCVRLLYVVSC